MNGFEFAKSILETLTNHHLEHFREAPGEIHISVSDAQALYDESNWCDRGLGIRHLVRDGETGSLWGRPFRANKDLKSGEAFIGYRVTV